MTLIGVVGPSGAGKDSLLAAAHQHFIDDPRIVFPRRAITRPGNDPGEDHLPLTEGQFDAGVARGEFALHWRAHGLCYGIPTRIRADLAGGAVVVVNLSRGVLDEARARFPGFRILSIRVDPAILRARLESRGRESAAGIAARLARMDHAMPEGADVTAIDNSVPLVDVVPQFCAAIAAALPPRAGL